MPEMIAVVTLSEDEKSVLASAGAQGSVKAVADEVAATVRTGGQEVSTLVKSNQLGRDRLLAAQRGLAQRLKALQHLPQGEARDKHLNEVTQALELIDHSLQLVANHGRQ